jgi:RNA polymerase sigma-70 factor (ECF subfamily)
MQVRLVERARAGDHDAFRELVEEHGHRCYALAYRVIREAEPARDAVQQAFVQAWSELPQLRDADRFEPWLYRLLVRACYVEAGRRRALAARTTVVWIDPPAAGDFTAGVAERDAIDRAFRRLTPEHRAVVVLHHYAGLPLAAVGDVVGIPVGTVKSRLHYATGALRSALDADSRAAILEETPA